MAEAHTLVKFVQDQFRRIDRWCWETIVEEVAERLDLPLDADRMTFIGGTIRVGRYAFRRNDKPLREFCNRVQTDRAAALDIIETVSSLLTTPDANGYDAAWAANVASAIAWAPQIYAEHAWALLRFNGLSYRGPSDYSSEISESQGVVYGLWRLDKEERPFNQTPLYIGEANDTVLSRIVGPKNKCHRDWWGDGKSIGVTVLEVPPDQRKAIESHLIVTLMPFANSSKSSHLEKWPDFARSRTSQAWRGIPCSIKQIENQ